ncbi:MAG: lipid-A-disaccharide synthase [Bacteroidia bacterium]|nr:lipid-A-disaccharide synthase [Bacteroidia bacterium]
MRYFIIAGEQSGDLHGSNLIRELIAADRDAEIFCWGGDLMEAAGATLLMHYKKTAFMGFTVVLKNLRTISRNLSLCKQHITDFNPDTVILIDYPGFNLRIAEFAKSKGFRIFYYISPKLWAWNESRVEKIREYVDRMYIIFPFEVSFYKGHEIDVEYRGNPLVDETERRMSALPGKEELLRMPGLDNRPVIGLLAGSRRHEVEAILPQMIKVVRYFPEYQFVLAGVKNLPDELYMKIIGKEPVKLLKDKTYEILTVSEAALVASGTATLEAALFNTPQVVCYKGDFFSMLIALMVIKVKYISLVNLIMDMEVVKELKGYSLNRNNLLDELKPILQGGTARGKMLEDYKLLKEKLGPSGASGRIASAMIERLTACAEASAKA